MAYVNNAHCKVLRRRVAYPLLINYNEERVSAYRAADELSADF